MENLVHNSYSKYFNALRKTGNVNYSNVYRLLVFTYIWELLENDYRGEICECDYNTIEKALYCLYGSSCLIPYPDFSMNRLKIGEVSEIAHRLYSLEEDSASNVHPRLDIIEEVVDTHGEDLEAAKIQLAAQGVIINVQGNRITRVEESNRANLARIQSTMNTVTEIKNAKVVTVDDSSWDEVEEIVDK